MREAKTYRIGAMHTNARGFLTLRSLTELMFDVSFIQAEKIEKDLDMEGLAWLVYSWDIEIKEPIKAGDEIKITTIPTHMKRFYAYRNFLVERNGDLLARAHTTFLLFDTKRLRPRIIGKEVLDAYGKDESIMDEVRIKRAKAYGDTKKIYTRNTDIDVNGHVNNAVYFDYLAEIDGLKDEDISFVKLVYKNEIRERKSVDLSYNKDGELVFSIDSDDINHAYGVIRYV